MEALSLDPQSAKANAGSGESRCCSRSNDAPARSVDELAMDLVRLIVTQA